MLTLGLSLKTLPYFVPPTFDDLGSRGPVRKTLRRPPTSHAFVAPMRQSFIKDARLMPGTRCMIALLAGWGGDGRPVDTTLGAIGKHLGRSARQVHRYMRDAAEEGYLHVRQITNRMGYITGLRITLCKAAIFAPKKKQAAPDRRRELAPQSGRKQAMTQEADINPTIYLNPETSDPFELKLMAICKRNDLAYQTG